MTISLFGRR